MQETEAELFLLNIKFRFSKRKNVTSHIFCIIYRHDPRIVASLVNTKQITLCTKQKVGVQRNSFIHYAHQTRETGRKKPKWGDRMSVCMKRFVFRRCIRLKVNRDTVTSKRLVVPQITFVLIFLFAISFGQAQCAYSQRWP